MIEMEELPHPVKEKIKHGIIVFLNALGWISLGLILGFGTMWGALEFAFLVNAPIYHIFEVNRTILFVGLVMFCVTAFLLRFRQHRQKAIIGDYWRILISLVVCMAIGALVFNPVNGLISLV